MKTEIYKFPMNGPEDLSGLRSLVEDGTVIPNEIVAIIAKTEGNGNVNDFTRGYTTFAIKSMLSNYLDCTHSNVSERVSIVCSGGCEGVMSPHATVFTKKNVNENKVSADKRFAIGVSKTRELLPEEIGTCIHAKLVCQNVKEAMALALIENIQDVHYVQIKCPLLTSDRINDAEGRGKQVVTKDTLKSMAFSRGASSLGVAMALNEVDEDKIVDSTICNDWSHFSSVASASAGIELMNNEIIVMGNSKKSISNCIIGHSVMNDPIDSMAVRNALQSVGINANPKVDIDDQKRLINVFAKAEAHTSGLVKNRRTTMLTDSDINSTRYARAVVNAVIASIVDDPMVYVSGGSEHQGPLGGGPVSVIAYIA